MLAALMIVCFLGTPAEAASCQGATIAPGSSDRLLCSKNLYGSGTCRHAGRPEGWGRLAGLTLCDAMGTDLDLNRRNFDGRPRREHQYAFAGKSYTPDVMFWHPLNTRAASVFFPPGTAMPFPESGGANAPHLGAHISRTGGGAFQFFYTVFYTGPMKRSLRVIPRVGGKRRDSLSARALEYTIFTSGAHKPHRRRIGFRTRSRRRR